MWLKELGFKDLVISSVESD